MTGRIYIMPSYLLQNIANFFPRYAVTTLVQPYFLPDLFRIVHLWNWKRGFVKSCIQPSAKQFPLCFQHPSQEALFHFALKHKTVLASFSRTILSLCSTTDINTLPPCENRLQFSQELLVLLSWNFACTNICSCTHIIQYLMLYMICLQKYLLNQVLLIRRAACKKLKMQRQTLF